MRIFIIIFVSALYVNKTSREQDYWIFKISNETLHIVLFNNKLNPEIEQRIK